MDVQINAKILLFLNIITLYHTKKIFSTVCKLWTCIIYIDLVLHSKIFMYVYVVFFIKHYNLKK